MYNWRILKQYTSDKNIINIILENRGIVLEKDQHDFLNPPPISYWFKDLPQEFLKNIKEARNLILEAIQNNKAIIIHGDYDADGVCATAILYSAIKKTLNYEKVYPFIPDRFQHGYGLSTKSIASCLELLSEDDKKNGALFITVDSGITSVDEVAYIRSLGHMVIITDHHQKPSVLPDADVLVWNDKIVGSTISWILSTALGQKDKSFLVYCGLATVTDLQPLTGFNRSIVKYALDILNEDPPVGLKKIIELAGKSESEITSYDLGWVIGPRLNATGRVLNAAQSLELLLEEDEEHARDLAWQLNEINSQRQDKTLEMYDLAESLSETEVPKIIVSHNENYHEGIIGLVASKLVQKYYRPTIVISTSEEVARGSVRSIPGFNVIEFLREMNDMFINLGGHPQAAGFSIYRNNVPKLIEKVKELSLIRLNDELLTKSLEIDISIPSKLINNNLMEDIEKLKPFGLGNDLPIFSSFNLGISNISFVGKDNRHVSLKLFDGENFYKAIYFDGKSYMPDLVIGDKVDIVYTLKRNNFNNGNYIDLIIKDIKKSE